MKKNITIIVIALSIVFAALANAAETLDRKSQSFKVEKGGELIVSTDGGSIHVDPWEKDEVFVSVDGIDEEDMEDLSMTQNGNTVRIRYNGSRNSSGDIRFTINVPSRFDIDIQTAGGDLAIEGNLTGNVKGRTSGGDIKMESITGNADMTTAGGSIRAKDVQGDLILNTSGGDLEAGWVNGEATLHTSGGSIRINGTGKDLDASTAGGNITFGEVRGTTSVSTSGGNINGKKSVGKIKMNTAGGNIDLDEGSSSVKARTAGGNVTLGLVTGSVDASTAGGDVEVGLRPEGNERSSLSTAGGRVVLSIPENAKATIDARIRIEGRWKSHMKDYTIQSDFKASSERNDEDDHEIQATYILNGGGQQIDLKTVNSDILIKKLKK